MRFYSARLPALVAWRVVRFLPRFLMQAVLGGADVARRAVDPRLPVAPGWVRLPLTGTLDHVNVLVGGIISVLPGTVAAGPADRIMDVHVLNLADLSLEELRADERRVLALFDRHKVEACTRG